MDPFPSLPSLGPSAPRFLGLDVGGTKIAAGVVDTDGHIVERVPAVPCPAADQDAMLKAAVLLIEALRSRHPDVAGVGVGVAGLVDWPDGRVRTAPNSAFRDAPLRRLLRDATGLPTVVDNDANTACWAEYRLGHSASYMAFVTVGTGVGGGLVLDDRLFRGGTGIGTEIGHMIVDPHGTERCGCGTIGCLEPLASGPALARYATLAAAGRTTGHLAAGRRRVTGEDVTAAAQAGDPAARAQLARIGHWLGIGIATLVNLFDIELVVLGGGVAGAGEPLLTPVRESFEEYVTARAHRDLPDIRLTRCGPEAGWVGAALLARDGLRVPGPQAQRTAVT
ncbi:ROK family protein [Streptomyces spectabilis]|uniref:ROK family protein n=1 Tax=Streptomyces spectabilis TaxID=68270 RepID=UPI0033FA2E91